MRIAILSDIHGNFVALETVLADIDRERVDQLVCLGDVVFGGAQPRECLARLRARRVPTVQGNTDAHFITTPTPDPNSEADARMMRIIEWGLSQLSADDLDFLKMFPPRLEIPLEGGKTLLCFHGSPRSNTEVILATTPDADLATILGDERAAVLAGGHTHTQMFRRFRQSIIINPGSVGMPIERGATPVWDYHPPWGEYAILIMETENLRVELRRVPLAVAAVVGAIRASGLSDGEKLAQQWESKS